MKKLTVSFLALVGALVFALSGCSNNDNFTEKSYSSGETEKLSGTAIFIFRYSADGFVPIKSVQFLLNVSLTVNSFFSDTEISRYSFSPSK